jgi:hypothetical protein
MPREAEGAFKEACQRRRDLRYEVFDSSSEEEYLEEPN